MTALEFNTLHSKPNRFLIGREKPGTQSEVARLISETLEQEKKHQQRQQHLDDHYEHSTEEVGHLLLLSPAHLNVPRSNKKLKKK